MIRFPATGLPVFRAAAIAIAFALGGSLPALSAPKYETIYNFLGAKDGYHPNGKLAMDEDGALYGATTAGGKVCPTGEGSCGGVIYQLSQPKKGKKDWGYSVLYSFKGGEDGAYPLGGVARERSGVLNGSTQYGGNTDCTEPHGWGCGTIFRLYPPAKKDKAWTKQVLQRFSGDDGSFPDGPPTRRYGFDALYGTTTRGGPANGGVFYEFLQQKAADAPAQAFEGVQSKPQRWKLSKQFGFLFTSVGGTPIDHPTDCGENEEYQFNPTTKEEGCNCPFGFNDKTEQCCAPFPLKGACSLLPFSASLIAPAAKPKPFRGDGSLFGAASAGGDDDCVNSFNQGCGVVYEFKQKKPGKLGYRVLYSFLGGTDGYGPSSAVTIGPDGSLYGTTQFGGKPCAAETTRGCGVVYRVSPPEKGASDWTETVLYRFEGGKDGARPVGGVEFGPDGALYGTSSAGGGCQEDDARGCGVLFRLTPPKDPDKPWSEDVVYRFGRSRSPNGPILIDNDGTIYGTTLDEVFRVSF